MHQTRLESLAEVVINVAIGWVIATITQFVIFPMFGIQITFSQQLGISAIFTAVSIVRSYVIRRWFNAGIHRLAIQFIRKIQ